MNGFSTRQAKLGDAERIYALIGRNADNLVPRSLANIVESIDRFVIAEADGEMAGCASYQIHPEIGAPEAATVEIVSVAVKTVFRRRGIGRTAASAASDFTAIAEPAAGWLDKNEKRNLFEKSTKPSGSTGSAICGVFFVFSQTDLAIKIKR